MKEDQPKYDLVTLLSNIHSCFQCKHIKDIYPKIWPRKVYWDITYWNLHHRMKNTSFRYQDLIDDHANLEHVTVLKILENHMPVIIYHRFEKEVSRFNSLNKTLCGIT